MKRAAEIIKHKKSEILDLWKEAVNENIHGSEETEPLVLSNIIPFILDDMAAILEFHDGLEDLMVQENYDTIIKDSLGHGRHRATSENYTEKKMIREYIFLHREIINLLKSHSSFNEDIGIVISFTLNYSISHAIGSFSSSLNEMRTKLTGTLAHDIRNPLSAAYLGVTTMKYEDGAERFQKIRDMVGNSLRRTVDLVEGLMDSMRVKAGEGISLNFFEKNIVEDVKLVCWEASESFENEIKLNCTKEEINGIFDPTSIRRLMENLVTNAVKYGSNEKPITVSVEDKGEEVLLKVHNYGSSISPDQQDRIFEFLNRGNNHAPEGLHSWGIGLTFVKMAAEAHGGDVKIKSDENKKETTFIVNLAKHANKPGRKRVKLNFGKSPG